MNNLTGWIRPDGRFIPLRGKDTHVSVIWDLLRQGNMDAIKAGWIRVFSGAPGHFYAEMWNAGDEEAVDRLGDFLYDRWLKRFPRESMATLEIHEPVNTFVYFTNGQMRDDGWKDLLADLVRAAILKSAKR